MKTLYLNGIVVGEIATTGNRNNDLDAARQFLRDRGLDKRPSIAKTMLGQAVSFASAANHIYKKDLAKTPVNPLGIAPFVVNAAFGTEVYLKTLHRLSGSNPGKEHKLLALFDSLPTERMNDLLNAASRHAPEYRLEKDWRFRDLLKQVSTAFVDWRYLYERERVGEVHILHTIFIMKACHEACRPATET